MNVSLEAPWQHHSHFRGNGGTEKVAGVAFQEIAPGEIHKCLSVTMGASWRAWFPSGHLNEKQIFMSAQHPVALTMTLTAKFSEKFL